MATCSDLGYSKNDILLFKYNGTPDNTNGFLVLDSIQSSNSPLSEEHNLVGDGKMNNIRKSYDTNNIQSDISISLLAEGTGALGVVPKISDFYKAAGLSEDPEVGVKVEYTPHFNPIEASTAVIYKGGKQKTAYTNMIAGMSMSGAIGTDIKINFPLSGFTDLTKTYDADPNIADIEFNSAFKVDLITAITIGGTSVEIESFDLALNPAISKKYFTELKCAVRTGLAPSLSLVAVKSFSDASAWSDFLNQTAKEIIIVATNRDGETLTIKASNAIPLPVEDGESEGILTETRSYDLKNDANSVPFVITYS